MEGVIRERRGRGKPRNMNRGLMGTDIGWGMAVGMGRDGVRVSNGEKGGTTVTKQQ